MYSLLCPFPCLVFRCIFSLAKEGTQMAIIPFVSLPLQGCEGIRKAVIPSQPLSFAAQGKGHNKAKENNQEIVKK